MQQVKVVSTPTKIVTYPNNCNNLSVFGYITSNPSCHGLAISQALTELRELNSSVSIIDVVTTELSNEIITCIYYKLV